MTPAADRKWRSEPVSSEPTTPRQQQQQQQKPRGRPRKPEAGEDDLVKKRRARNREAQLVFRVRKQALQEVQEKQIRKLEETIERISSAFMGLADTMLQSQVALTDAPLMEKLGRTTENIVDLTRSLDDGEGSETPSPAAVGPAEEATAANKTSQEEPKEINPLEAGPHPAGLPVESASQMTSAGPTGTIVTRRTPSPNTRIFGNGWFGQVASNYPYLEQCTVQPLPNVSDYPLAMKIIIATIQIGYHALFETIQLSGDSSRMIVDRVFNYSLRYHSAEEIMFNLRWFLGPGQLETHRLGNISFVTGPFAHIYREALKSHRRVGEFVPAIDDDAFREVVPAQEPVSQSAAAGEDDAYVNANAVEHYLWEKGIWFVGNDDIIEVPASVIEPVRSPSAAAGSSVPGPARKGVRGQPPRPWEFFNFNTFFVGDRPPSPGASTIRVSQTKLLQSLVGTAVCMASGPGYERRLIDEAIKAAVVA